LLLPSRSLHASPSPFYAVRPSPHTVGYKTDPTAEESQVELSTLVDQIDEQVTNGDGVLGNQPKVGNTPNGPPEVRYKGFKEGQDYKPFGLKKNRRLDKPQRIIHRSPRFGPGAKQATYKDAFLYLGIDPLKEALNDALLSKFVTTMGKIKGRNETGLSRNSQRRMGKAVRRARAMGILPMMSKPVTLDLYR